MTTEAKFTPGPWVIAYGGMPADDYFTVASRDMQSVADFSVANYSKPMGNAEMMANARLIAAAPDMLAALELAAGLEPYLDPANFDGHAAHALKAIDAAIRKARG